MSRTIGARGTGLPARDELAYGEQRLVEIAIAVALKPRVLMLDEPAAGVPGTSPGTSSMCSRGCLQITVLLIEHDMDLVFRFARRVIVLVAGAILFEGTPSEVAANQEIRDIYLGRDGHGATGL